MDHQTSVVHTVAISGPKTFTVQCVPSEIEAALLALPKGNTIPTNANV